MFRTLIRTIIRLSYKNFQKRQTYTKIYISSVKISKIQWYIFLLIAFGIYCVVNF